jgi:soluble lytic murein transglycosylase-like protein
LNIGYFKVLVITGLFALSTVNSYAFCFKEAGVKYGINPDILEAVAHIESNLNPNANNVNIYKSGFSVDRGLMQVNDVWMPELRQYGFNEVNIYEPCSNVMSGAYILAKCIQVFGYTWESVGCYHVGSKNSKERKERRDKYIGWVSRIYKKKLKE